MTILKYQPFLIVIFEWPFSRVTFFPDVTLLNQYGPTEASANVMQWHADHPKKSLVEKIGTVKSRDQLILSAFGEDKENIDDRAKNYNIFTETINKNDINNIMSNSFGFGGTNATLVFSKI